MSSKKGRRLATAPATPLSGGSAVAGSLQLHAGSPEGKSRDLVLVLGMHRSGTSALTGLLGKLGVELGEALLPANSDNPKGYFENEEVVATHEALFRQLGREWHDPRALPANWLESAAGEQARGELARVVFELLSRNGTVSIKDPRSCRVVDLWIGVARQVQARPSAILMVRHPQEVAASLARRDGLSSARAHLLWIRYLLDAEHATRGIARAFVSYDALLGDWQAQTRWLDEQLDLALAARISSKVKSEVDGFLDASLRNNVASSNAADSSPFEPLALALYLLARECSKGRVPDAAARFDAFEDEWQSLATHYLAAIDDTLALELPLELKAELSRQGLDRSRIDNSLHLAALRELWRPSTIARAPGACKLYYREESTHFIEARSVSVVPIVVEAGLCARFELPAGVQADYLRIDPDDAAGVFAVQSLGIDGDLVEDLAQRVTNVSEVQLPITTARAMLRFASSEQDPYFELDVRGRVAAAVRPVVIEMRFRTETVASELGEQMHDFGLGLRRVYEALQQAQETTGESLAAGLDGLHDVLREVDQTQAAAIAQLREEVQRSADESRAGLTALHDSTRVLSRELQQALQSISARMGRVDSATAERAASSLRALVIARAEHLDIVSERRDNALAVQMAMLQEQQASLLRWAQRRSPRYWWRRLRGRAAPQDGSVAPQTRAELVPLANLRSTINPDGITVWTSEDSDPQFLLRCGSGPLHGGWYLLDVVLDTREGRLQSPCLYPDYGDGVSEVERHFVPEPDGFGRIRAVVRLKAPAARLRFDPSVSPVTFSVRQLTFRRVGRLRALIEMLRGAASPEAGSPWRNTMAILQECLRPASWGRAQGVGEQIHARYLEAKAPVVDDYEAWVREFDTITSEDLIRMREDAAKLPRRPTISIVMPVYQTPERWLRKCLDSVLAQAYPHWELCVADDASPSSHVRRVLEEYRRRDPRIRVVLRAQNGHISKASNSALELATGEFVALLDHDDELRPHALLEMVKAINAHPQWRMIYSDEDKIDERGRRSSPYFKPDWNHELFLGQNCVCHLGLYHTALVREVGGFRVGLEGSQDWDLALRCSEKLEPAAIGHVSKVLYHWRAIAGSTALGAGQKDYASGAGMRAVSDHLNRVGCKASIEINPHGHVNVRRALPATPPRVSLIIPTRDKVELLRMCVTSILDKTDYPDYELLVVDNQSTEPETLAYFNELASEQRVRVIAYDAPFNYSAINNHAARLATGAILGLVNNDIEVISADWLREMVSHAARPEIGAVGALLYYPNDTIQHAGVILGIGGVAGHAYTGSPAGFAGQCGRALLSQEMSAVTAACLLVRKELFFGVGGLDEQLSVAFNDIDLCLRIRKEGYRNIWTPHAKLYHHESASRGYEDTPEKNRRFKSETDFMTTRWGDILLSDPAYNLNLSASVAFGLASPPRN